jgi:hypothetical protein
MGQGSPQGTLKSSRVDSDAEGWAGLKEEVDRLRAEIKEKDVLLEAREMEVKMIKQTMEKRIRELERIVKRLAREREKPSRLASFVGTIEKRH